MSQTSIEWAHFSLNPGVYGCAKASPACDNCYAMGMAHRLVAMGRYPEGITERRNGRVQWTGDVQVDFDRIKPAFDALPKDGKRRRVFVTSMGDLFHKDVPREFQDRVLDEMAARPSFRFLVLTKRPDVMAEYAGWRCGDLGGFDDWPVHIWVGTTVEDQQRANERIPHLLRVPAAVRFLSCEPLLGEVDVSHWLNIPAYMALREGDGPPGLDWVIAGGESGPKARPSHPGWLRSLRAQCEAAGVPFFFKQWGEWAPINRGPGDDIGTIEYGRQWKRAGFFTYNDHWHEAGANPYRQSLGHVGKHAAGRLLDGREWSEVPA